MSPSLTWGSVNPGMDISHHMPSKVCENYLSIPKFQRLHHSSLGYDVFHTLLDVIAYPCRYYGTPMLVKGARICNVIVSCMRRHDHSLYMKVPANVWCCAWHTAHDIASPRLYIRFQIYLNTGPNNIRVLIRQVLNYACRLDFCWSMRYGIVTNNQEIVLKITT